MTTKALLLASVIAIASFPGFAHAAEVDPGIEDQCRWNDKLVYDDPACKPPAHVTVAPPYQGPPPIGWVYGPYTQCGNPPQCSMGMVNVPAAGLNVRTVPNGPPVMALVNGVPLYPVTRQGDWILVAAACDLTPTFAWSWTAGVPLNRCWVYF
jgi:hypothetical protein